MTLKIFKIIWCWEIKITWAVLFFEDKKVILIGEKLRINFLLFFALIEIYEKWNCQLDKLLLCIISKPIKLSVLEVSVKCLVNGVREEVFNGDCVLCTIPLGVLKRSVRNRNNAPIFHPELPRWKIDAINSLGFGNVNKVSGE